MTRATSLTVIALCLAGCAAATTSPARPETRAAPPREDARAPARAEPGTVDIEADDAPVASVLAAVARQTGRPIALVGSCDERLTFTLRRAPWRDVLDYVARRARLVERREGNVLVFEARPRTTLQAQDADLASWVRVLASGAGRSVVLPGHLRGVVTAELRDVTYDEALRVTAETYGFEVVTVGD